MKKILSVILVISMIVTQLVFSLNVSADTVVDFTFSDGTMSKEVLSNYLSRAVTLQGFCVENETEDTLFEEDLRMIRRIGAKFIGRAAFYSWGGNMNNEQIENHFKLAKEKAELAHAADTELILQAGVFEIMYKGTVESTPVPAWVLEEFDQTVTERNFSFDAMLPPEGSEYGIGYWDDNQDTAVPYIGNIETQMYIYYLITRYIDAGYEAVHLGQVELIMNRENKSGSERLNDWDTVLTKARAYAKENARRGVVLFDGHRELDSSGLKIDDRMLMDFYSCGGVAHETETVDDAECAAMTHYEDNGVSWIGRTPGGTHPLGFEMDTAFTLVEFDNFNGTAGIGVPHTNTENDVFCWGYDIITWYATQPEWYRNQYLTEANEFLKSVELNSEGKQTYFLQPACRRVICPEEADNPVITYTLSDDFDTSVLTALSQTENITYEINSETNELTVTMPTQSIYRANYQSNSCVTGSGQEDTIRTIFLGDAEEDQSLLPEGHEKIIVETCVINEFRVLTAGNDKDPASSIKEYNENELNVGDLGGTTKVSTNGNKTVRVLKAGDYNIFKIEIDKNATAIQLADFKIDSADGGLYQYHFYLSNDNSMYNIIGSYNGWDGQARTITEHGDDFSWATVDQGWIRADNNKSTVAGAPLNEAGDKKVLYLKLSAKGGDSQNESDIDANAQISYVSFVVQSVVPVTAVAEKTGSFVKDEFRILTAGNDKDSTSSIKEYNENELNIGDLGGTTKVSTNGNKTVRVLKAGDYNIFKIEIDKNATAIQLADFKIDSADGGLYQYHFYLSNDNSMYNIIASYSGWDGQARTITEHSDDFSWATVDQGWIRADNNKSTVAGAPLNEAGDKKVLYLKLSSKGGDSQNESDIDANAQISYVSFVVQSVVDSTVEYGLKNEMKILANGNTKNSDSTVSEYTEDEVKVSDLQGVVNTSTDGTSSVRVLKAGENNVFKIEIDANATVVRLSDFVLDSADGELYQYHFYLSSDNSQFNIIGSYDNSDGLSIREYGDTFSWDDVDQGWIRAQNNKSTVAAASLNATGDKKVLYLKLSAKGGDSQNENDIDESAQISYVSFVVQSVTAVEYDLNADGESNASDLTLLRRKLLGTSLKDEVLVYADMNDDTYVDIRDLVRLKKTLAN